MMKRIIRGQRLAGLIVAAIAATSFTLASQDLVHAQGLGASFYHGFGQGKYGRYGRSN